ncbi:MAG: hypothetical protein H6739_41955 [Alphaproteobacteria bacterium]|nr:hypothetical protein [Alphaproteobacteria bacterium]
MSGPFALLASADPDDFGRIAELLLNRAVLSVSRKPHRLVEIELYLNGPGHADPYAHGDPVQRHAGRWYLHRTAGGLRGGSFKGLDLTLGPEGVPGGVLIRSLRDPDGRLINGCSLCVDHLLAQTGCTDVAALDAALGARRVWAPGPLQLVADDALPRAPVLATARVGLTLKRWDEHPTMPAFLMRPYRFLTEPALPKGRLQTVLALHQQGRPPEAIRAATGSTARAIASAIAAYEAGLAIDSFERWRGQGLGSAALATAMGAWARRFG